MHVELTSFESRVILEALKKYRTIKNAEGKLTSQREKNKADIDAAYAPYQKLLDIIDVTIQKVSA